MSEDFLVASESIVDANGRPSWRFQRIMQGLLEQMEVLAAAIATLPATYVAKDTTTNWVAQTGTAERTTMATYTAPTISNPPTQAEVQALANAVQALSRRQKALIDDLLSGGTIK